MTIFEEQFAVLQEQYPGSTHCPGEGGVTVVTVPNVTLPAGWSKPVVTVKFAAPVGYPLSQPDCFWADRDLLLASGAMPQASNHTNSPDGQSLLWFSWHVGKWSPNSDSLLTYMKVIERRFQAVQ